MALSEIEKLERRYAENPQGLTFAPLAEVHRKNGEVQRALNLLGAGLAIHPDYIPASIVLGRCHLDLGDVHAAEAAFLHVLSLDGENVIALKALADISERLLKFDDAERWLHTLLSVDRSNEDAREQLQRVEIVKRQAGVASSAEPTSVLEPEAPVEENAPVEVVDAAATEPVESVPLPELFPAYEPPVAEPAMGWVSQSSHAGEHASPPVEGLEHSAFHEPVEGPAGMQLEEPVRYEDEVQPIDGLIDREAHVPEDAGGDFRVETSEDIVLRSAGGSEFQTPDASQELFASGAHGQRAPLEEDAPVSPPPAPVEPAPPARAEPAPAVAEVAPPTPPRRTYVASETGGRPVSGFLKDILTARLPAQAEAPAVRQPAAGGGAPTRPAADALSLSSVFGEESPGTPPAVPAPGTGQGVSFDDFFGAPGAAPTQRATRAPDPKSDDLDQFHAWLQNLKR